MGAENITISLPLHTNDITILILISSHLRYCHHNITDITYQWYHDIIIDIESPKIHNKTGITYQWYHNIDIDINSPAILSLVRKRVNGKRKSLLCLPAVKSRKFNPKLLKCFFSSKFKREKVYARPNGSKTKNRITEMVFYIFPMNWRKKFALRGSSLFSTEVALRLPTTNENQSHPIPSTKPLKLSKLALDWS